MGKFQQRYAGQNFTMLLFPCNQFLNQEPHANDVVEKFAAGYLNLTDPTVKMFAKSDVNKACTSSSTNACAADSEDCCPANNAVYEYLHSVVPGDCSWNFNKYLVGPDGVPTDHRYDTTDYDDKLTPAIDKMLGM